MIAIIFHRHKFVLLHPLVRFRWLVVSLVKAIIIVGMDNPGYFTVVYNVFA